MTERTHTPASHDLIARFQAAESRRAAARRTITLTLIFVVFAFVFMIWQEVKGFRDEGVPKFAQLIEQEGARFAPEAYARVAEMLNRLYPAYVGAFADVYSRDEELFTAVLVDEFGQLEVYAHATWPRMEESIAQLVVDQEEAARAALAEVLAEDQVEAASLAYKAALQSFLTELFEEHFTQQITLGDNILNQLVKLAESEPETNAEDTQYILGMVLELLGLTMQDNTSAGEAE